jgi:hypothetical protein
MMAKFKSATEYGVTVYYPSGSIRLDAGQVYETTDEREIEVLSGAGGVEEVKAAGKKK